MAGKPRREGYLLIDHTFSPGITPEELHAAGVAGPAVKADCKGEFGTVDCCHCGAIVILNPKRTRPREYCPKCDKYMCDCCAVEMGVTGVCRNFDKLLDYVQECNAKQEDQGLTVTGLPDLSPLYASVSVPVPDLPPQNKG